MDGFFSRLQIQPTGTLYQTGGLSQQQPQVVTLFSGQQEDAEAAAWYSYPSTIRRLCYEEHFTIDERVLLVMSNQVQTLLFECYMRRGSQCAYPMDAHEELLRRCGAFLWCAVSVSAVKAQGYHALATSYSLTSEQQVYVEYVYTFKKIKKNTEFVETGSLNEASCMNRPPLSSEIIDDYIILHVLYVQPEEEGAGQRAAALESLCPDPCDVSQITEQYKEKKLWRMVDLKFQWRDLFDVSDE